MLYKKEEHLRSPFGYPLFWSYKPKIDSRCEMKSRSSSPLRGRSHVASCKTSLNVTGSILAFVDSMTLGCLLFVFVALCIYFSISMNKSQ